MGQEGQANVKRLKKDCPCNSCYSWRYNREIRKAKDAYKKVHDKVVMLQASEPPVNFTLPVTGWSEPGPKEPHDLPKVRIGRWSSSEDQPQTIQRVTKVNTKAGR